MVTLVAESGLGKTRLVQEFYRWLATAEDGGSGYWPADLAAVDDNLLINPDPAACDSTRPVPFLWWGLRLPDPGARNQAVAGQLASALDTLTPHLEPALRTERRRQSGKGMALAAGNVALDFALNLVPAFGVLKTIGQGALELGQHARTLWVDSHAVTPGELHGQQREGLADRVVSDFNLLLSREAADAPAVPVVIVVDDAQFSVHDPSIVTFVEKMTAAAIAGRWRVLFLVTYWTAEWNQHNDAGGPDDDRTVGRVVAECRAALGDAWTTVHLAPVEDLSPHIAAVLPGLDARQTAALLDRAGGNPRYLDEILRYCERNERLFVGRSLTAPLTEKGLATLLERTGDLHDLVEERLHALEPSVRRALLLASVQGQEFLVPLVEETSAILQETAGEPELARAEHPHAFIQRDGGRVGAFAQRVFHEVAVGQIGNDFDEDDVQEALRDAVRRRLDAFDALPEADDIARFRTCLTASELLVGTDDEDDARRVMLALMHLVHACQARHDDELAWRFGDRLASSLHDPGPRRVPAYAYHVAATTLMDRGRYDEASALLEAGVAVQHSRASEEPGGTIHDDLLALLLGAAGRCAYAAGRLDDAERHAFGALDVRRRSAGTGAGAGRDLLVACLDAGHIAKMQGYLDDAADLFDEAYALARALAAAAPTRQSREDVVTVSVAVGDVAASRGLLDRAAELYAQGLAALDEPAPPGTDPDADARKAVVLERIGRTAHTRGDLDAARTALEDALAIRRRLVEHRDTLATRAALANGLRMLGDIHWDRQDLSSAWQTFAESLSVLEATDGAEPTSFSVRVRSLALERLGRVALATDDLDAAEHIFERRLQVDRDVAAVVRTPAAWRDVLTSEFWLADIAEQRGDGTAAEARFADALQLARDLYAHDGSASARDDARRILARLVQLARTRGDEVTAAEREGEAFGFLDDPTPARDA